jgi:hypothetical protein
VGIINAFENQTVVNLAVKDLDLENIENILKKNNNKKILTMIKN